MRPISNYQALRHVTTRVLAQLWDTPDSHGKIKVCNFGIDGNSKIKIFMMIMSRIQPYYNISTNHVHM